MAGGQAPITGRLYAPTDKHPKTHDLDLLFDLIADQESTIPGEFDMLRDLVDFSVQYRYEAFEDLPLERDATFLLVERFVALAAARLGE